MVFSSKCDARVVAETSEEAGPAEQALRQYSSLFDVFSAAILLVDAQARILAANEAARHLLHEGEALKSERGRLIPVNHRDEATIRDIIEKVASAPSTEDYLHSAVCKISTPNRGYLTLIACPGSGGHLKTPKSDISGTALLMIPASPEAESRFAETMVAELFGLSPAEERIAGLVAAGMTPAEMMETTNLSMPTVRTHLSHIYQKTETGSYSKLMRLLLSFDQFRSPAMQRRRAVAAPTQGRSRHAAASQRHPKILG